MRQLVLTATQMEAMRRHVVEGLPFESCGLLAGRGGEVQKVMFIANQARSSVRFRMEPLEQLRAFNSMEEHGLELVGIFHSHPSGPDRPSQTDIEEAAYPVIHLIWSRREADWSVKGYWIEGQRVTEVRLEIAAGG